jgi:hypothetical protein
MDWIALCTFGAVALLSLGLARGAAANPVLGVQAIAAIAGFALCVLFLAVGGSTALAWGAFAASAVGVVAVALGVSWLTSDRHPVGNSSQQSHEETEAELAGIELPLFVLAATFALLTALGVATVN